MGVKATPRAYTSDLCSRRLYSAPKPTPQQVLLNKALQRRDTSDWWKKATRGATTPQKGVNSQPYAGGFARNNLRSTPKAHALPTFKPFFEIEVPAANSNKRSSSVSGSVGTQAADKPQPVPVSASPRPASGGGAGFFFRNKGGAASTELPSARWAPKLIPKESFAPPMKVEPVPTKVDQVPTVAKVPDYTVKSEPVTKPTPAPITPRAMNAATALDMARARASAKSGKSTKFVEPSNSAPLSPIEILRQAREKSQNPKSRNIVREAEDDDGTAQKHTQHPMQKTPGKFKEEVRRGAPKRDAPKRDAPRKGRGDAPKRAGRSGDKRANFDGDRKKRSRRRYRFPRRGKEVTIPLTITVDSLAKLLGVPNDHLLRKMSGMEMDKLASDYLLSNEEAADIALEYGVVPVIPEEKGPEIYPRITPDDMSMHPLRPPVVTIMGHVDHGKTTLLDTLRSSSITASEAGGITQHIGAFSVQLDGGQNITFLDTPGHAAFSAMRARGANATDIVVLVVAADDGVMPQTKEAIQHALDADVPIIVAINKCDKAGVDPSQIKEELLQYGIQTEDLGGDIQAVEISALKGTGVDELSENIVTLAEVLDLRAEVDIPVHATVIESQVEKGHGNIASVLVKRGTLNIGDIIVAGTAWCKVRNMTDDRGNSVSSVGPAGAARVTGWKEIPHAGDMALQAESEAQAKSVVNHRVEKRKNKKQLAAISSMNEKRRETHARENIERAEEKAHARAVREYYQGIRSSYPDPLQKTDNNEEGDDNPEANKPALLLPIIVKGDVSGTVEAVEAALGRLPNKKIKPVVLNSGVGPVSESDVAVASSSEQCVIIAFNVKADKKTQNVAKRQKVQIMSSRIIYKLLEDVEQLMLDRLPSVFVDELQGEAVVQQVFDITLKGNKTASIAGSRVTSGQLTKSAKTSVLRNDKVLYTGDISSFKNVKSDIFEASKGQEFGIAFDGFEDLRQGDIIQSFRQKELPKKLE
ncbi:translation initiation factor IF-2 [Coemansia sp. RSA 720]|nr:translation initiation factor IF-2 [Coemansia sp. RSA 720]KAJ2538760.1 translation initiation factor IF-2 [Coemansia sp. RSA 1853]